MKFKEIKGERYVRVYDLLSLLKGELPTKINMPSGYTIEFHNPVSEIPLDMSRVQLYQTDEQKSGLNISGYDLLEYVAAKKPLDAEVFDWLINNPSLIPEEWKSRGTVCSLGTVFRDSDGDLYVRALHWDGSQWHEYFYWVGSDWGGRGFVALLAS